MPGSAVHFGGGNIGRGFIAELLHETGYEVIFVDVVDKLIDDINATKSYTITEVGAEGRKTKTITNYKAINSKHNMDATVDAIANADIVTCAVGPNVLRFIAKPIADGIAKRTASKPLAVIACENMINATDKLRDFIVDEKNMSAETKSELPKRAEFGNSAIDRIVPTQPSDAGLDVVIETFFEWCVETTGFKSGHPDIKGIHWVDDLEPYIERKLFTVNTSHATAAYFGYYKGIKTSTSPWLTPKSSKRSTMLWKRPHTLLLASTVLTRMSSKNTSTPLSQEFPTQPWKMSPSELDEHQSESSAGRNDSLVPLLSSPSRAMMSRLSSRVWPWLSDSRMSRAMKRA